VIRALAVAAGLASAAWANGDEFYRFNALDPKALARQVIFAGIVKDENGRHLEDVKITVGVGVETMYGPKRVTYNAYTNVAGRYRSLDVASVVQTLEEVEIEVDPAAVEVTATKAGYSTVRKLSRSPARQKAGVFEFDFVMAKHD
jgi:hypothetical protein